MLRDTTTSTSSFSQLGRLFSADTRLTDQAIRRCFQVESDGSPRHTGPPRLDMPRRDGSDDRLDQLRRQLEAEGQIRAGPRRSDSRRQPEATGQADWGCGVTRLASGAPRRWQPGCSRHNPGSTDRRPGRAANWAVGIVKGQLAADRLLYRSSGRAGRRVRDSHRLSVPSFSRLRCTGHGGLTTRGLAEGPGEDRVPVRRLWPTATRVERAVSVGHRGGRAGQGWTGTWCARCGPRRGAPRE